MSQVSNLLPLIVVQVLQASLFQVVLSILSYAFTDCSNITSVTILNGVESIGWGAFNGCNSLKSIVIPKSVITISTDAFQECSSLKEVYYGGSELDWENVSMHNDCFPSNATCYYYSEIEPTEAGNYWHYVDGVVTKW